MVDGAAILMSMFWGMRHLGAFNEERGTNLLDTGAGHYDTYETADGKFISIGALEPQFFAEFMARTGLVDEDLPGKDDKDGWPVLKARFTELFKSKTRDDWCAELEGTDVCFAPVLPLSEAVEHPHIRARETIVEANGIVQPAPAPRFSRTPAAIQRPGPKPGQHTDEALSEWGFSAEDIAKLRDAKAIA
jgi:alpha-methylacyl-CoA racemase